MATQVFWSMFRTLSQKRVNRLPICSANVEFELTPEYSRSDCAKRNGIRGMFSGVGLTVPAFSAAASIGNASRNAQPGAI